MNGGTTLKTLKLKEDFWWTGIIDENLRVFDIIMYTEFGTSYNSYVLKSGETTVLFETAKAKFKDEWFDKIKEVCDPSRIDYLVLSHTEPDHAGSVEALLELSPNIKIIGTSSAITFLKEIVNRDFYSISVKDNQTMEIGNKTLQFLVVPNLHWPDTMYTYIVQDKTLVTCDSFGSHYGFQDVLVSKITDAEGYKRATKYYFDCIISPFKSFMAKALVRVKKLDIELICTGHGPVLDENLDQIIKWYEEWCTVVNPNTKKTVVIAYVSAYGYTKILAEKITEGIKSSGDIEVRTYDMVEADQIKVLDELFFADGLLLGTPTILGDALKPIWDLTTSMYTATHGKKLASAFGSYGWSGEGVPHIITRLKQLKMKVPDDGFRVRFKPSEVDLINAFEYGFNFGCLLQNKENPKKQGLRKLVKCLVCGEIFDSSLELCPVCGVGPDKWVEIVAEEVTFRNNTQNRYLILGGGVAALSAAAAIRDRDLTGKITMISAEPYLPINRPMLTKSMLACLDPQQIAIQDSTWFQEKNVDLQLEKSVQHLDLKAKTVTLSDGENLPYDKLIYALGAESFVPPIPGSDKPEVVTIRHVKDIAKINTMLEHIKNVVVIGGGVLGLEAAWEMKKAKCNVTVLELAPQLMGRQLDADTAAKLMEIAKAQDIEIKTGVKIEGIEGNSHVTGVNLGNDTLISADLVILSTGVLANTTLAKEAGLESERAIVVNEAMLTNVPDVYACGDCAQYNGVNFANWPEALEQGKVAGANAAGDPVAYQGISAGMSFHGMGTSLFAIGDAGKDPEKSYKTVAFRDDTKQEYEKYWFVNGQLLGAILLGNVDKIGSVTEAVEQHKLFKNMF